MRPEMVHHIGDMQPCQSIFQGGFYKSPFAISGTPGQISMDISTSVGGVTKDLWLGSRVGNVILHLFGIDPLPQDATLGSNRIPLCLIARLQKVSHLLMEL